MESVVRDGVKYCRSCGLPKAGQTASGSAIEVGMMSTTPTLAGYQIVASHGLVMCSVTVKEATEGQFLALRQRADALGANAVVGLQALPSVSVPPMMGEWTGSSTAVLAIGTAVTVQPTPTA
jgi:uncharacterized protein YbjQ (UPF0145 family)